MQNKQQQNKDIASSWKRIKEERLQSLPGFTTREHARFVAAVSPIPENAQALATRTAQIEAKHVR